MTDIVVTTDEANRLATGLTGAAAAERAEAEDVFVPPPRRTRLSAAHLHVETDAVPFTVAHGETGGSVMLGTLTAAVHLHGTWDVLEATLVAVLEAVRVARTGPA